MIEFVTVENMNRFSENALAAQHRLRYRSIIERQDWNVPNYHEMEFDQYDNPAAKYLVYRDENYIARGVSRFYPTTLPYMLEQLFHHFVTDRDIPKSPRVWEGSRFCIDQTLPPRTRKRIAQEIVVGYLETGLRHGIEGIIGLMYPAYWRSLFTSAGWELKFMGETTLLDDGNKARAAWLPVSESVLARVRRTTGIHETIVNFGEIDVKALAA
ncbi:MAG: acyl-homoserine-lactone synthase [Candidatus Acidiferrales bacterium]